MTRAQLLVAVRELLEANDKTISTRQLDTIGTLVAFTATDDQLNEIDDILNR